MALIVIRTCNTTTLGVMGTYNSLRALLVRLWGKLPDVYFDIQCIPTGSLFATEDNDEYFRKRHEEIAKVVREETPTLKRKDGNQVATERITDDFDARIAVSTAELHVIAIKQLIDLLPPDEAGNIIGKLRKTLDLPD